MKSVMSAADWDIGFNFCKINEPLISQSFFKRTKDMKGLDNKQGAYGITELFHFLLGSATVCGPALSWRRITYFIGKLVRLRRYASLTSLKTFVPFPTSVQKNNVAQATPVEKNTSYDVTSSELVLVRALLSFFACCFGSGVE